MKNFQDRDISNRPTTNVSLRAFAHTVKRRPPRWDAAPASVTSPADAAKHISAASGKHVEHTDIDRDAWIEAMTQSGVPAEYGAMLRLLTETICAGHGSRPNNDVQTATGTPSIRFEEFAARTAQAST